jgi:hypothetical protein
LISVKPFIFKTICSPNLIKIETIGKSFKLWKAISFLQTICNQDHLILKVFIFKTICSLNPITNPNHGRTILIIESHLISFLNPM